LTAEAVKIRAGSAEEPFVVCRGVMRDNRCAQGRRGQVDE